MRTTLAFIIILATALAFTVPLRAQIEAKDYPASAKAFVDLLEKGDFAGAVGRFDATMKRAAPEAKLAEIWKGAQGQFGPFKKQLRVRSEKLAGYTCVFVACQFERKTMDMKVVFDGQGRIAGLFFVPARDAAAASAPPPYANTNSFREKPVTVGEGEWALPATLALPASGAGPWPAVVLVHGSGPQDRDETVGALKPFRDLAWGLAAKGVAVLRYEKRTKEHAAKVAASLATLTLKGETIDDALSAAALLRATAGIDPKRVFVLGHSLGGMAAPRIGKADPQLAGLIILAGATRPLENLILEQTRYLLSLQDPGSTEAKAKLAEMETMLAKVKKLGPADASSSTLYFGAPAAYWLDLRAYDPAAAAKSLKQPMLILQGERDYQVTLDDFEGWKQALGSNPAVTFKLYPDLNHLFAAGKGKSAPAEYEQPGHVAETVVSDIAEWARGH